MKHQEHILCVKANKFIPDENGMSVYSLNSDDIMLGKRAALENDPDFRQILPVSVFTHNGKVWAYKRTVKGGESRLHDKVAVAVGGHWDMADLVIENNIIDIEQSLRVAIARELHEEVGTIGSAIVRSRPLEKVICASDTDVDKVHAGLVTIHELDGEALSSAEDQLETIGFVDPSELLNGDFNLETWARMICEMLISEAKAAA